MGCTRLDPERDAGFAAGSGEERIELATELETTLAVLPAPQDLVIAALKRSLAKA